MRALIVLASILSLAACSKPATDQQAADGAEINAAPGVEVTAAPGVALNYHYAFRLPPARIAGAQEAHAQACEKLGIQRCRITGMRYSVLGGDRIAASLALKLDPAIARGFGKDGIATINAADGMLVDAEITGTDAGTAITRAQQQLGETKAQLDRIDQQLARTDLNKDVRATLEQQRADIAQAPAQTQTQLADLRDSLATTPMVFDYESGHVTHSFDPRSPFADALATITASAQTTLVVVLQVIATLMPPLVVLTALWLLWRALAPWRDRLLRARRRLDAPSD